MAGSSKPLGDDEVTLRTKQLSAMFDLTGLIERIRAGATTRTRWCRRMVATRSPGTGHRCPGEWITVELMKRSARWLAGGMDYEVPPQDLALDMRRLPAIPKSGFLIRVGRRG
ncbi:hypothetical protein [Pseudoduganella lutea]|uniref:Uncharacterized protein n=1 Tax=Pseudoduganella lutea TaxID=321985 RepID=A0A4V0Z430_9BURK|nr:hypothetical protein [Pseudoduganella lutea]QBE65513.1 hypothetical protein EWM63_23055 [Pseudoduganella lutea]